MNGTLDDAVRAAFGPGSAEAMDVVTAYGALPHHTMVDRVRLAVVALAEGDLTRLRHFTGCALTDPRDVLWWVETPPGPGSPGTGA